jgi:uridine kinase
MRGSWHPVPGRSQVSRPQVLRTIAARIAAQPARPVTLTAVDGVDGAGKTVFADELARHLADLGMAVVRASVDGFHRPRDERYRRGRHSPEGFFLDSYDLDAFRGRLLDPLQPGGDRRIVRAVHDVDRDRPLDLEPELIAEGSVLVVDGIFLHRRELRGVWHHSVFLDVPFEVSVARMAARDGTDPRPDAPSNRRYVEGQRHYLRRCEPGRHATLVVDDTDLAVPTLREPGARHRATLGQDERGTRSSVRVRRC